MSYECPMSYEFMNLSMSHEYLLSALGYDKTICYFGQWELFQLSFWPTLSFFLSGSISSGLSYVFSAPALESAVSPISPDSSYCRRVLEQIPESDWISTVLLNVNSSEVVFTDLYSNSICQISYKFFCYFSFDFPLVFDFLWTKCFNFNIRR